MGVNDAAVKGCRVRVFVSAGSALREVIFPARELKIEAPSGPDVTHQQIVSLSAAQRSGLGLLAAWAEDEGALASRGLHVGQAERAQVLHALFHLQLIALSS